MRERALVVAAAGGGGKNFSQSKLAKFAESRASQTDTWGARNAVGDKRCQMSPIPFLPPL